MTSNFIDPRDGKSYKIVRLLDNNWWFAQNLSFNANESRLALSELKKNNIIAASLEHYSPNAYGRLYTWESAQKACPPGWRIPTKKEWRTMLNKYGGFSSCSISEKNMFSLIFRATKQKAPIKSLSKIGEYIRLKKSLKTRLNPEGAFAAAQYLKYNGYAGFNAMEGGFFRRLQDENYSFYGHPSATFWSADLDFFNEIHSAYIYHISGDSVSQCTEISSWLFSVRCIKE